MTVKPSRNVGASVRQRLLNLTRAGGPPFNTLLTRYVLERLLYRLTLTPHASRFVLKGAMLVTAWFPDPYRQTRDVDLLGFGDPARVVEQGSKFANRDREIGAEEVLAVEVVEGLSDRCLAKRGAARITGCVHRVLVRVGKLDERVKERWQ